MLNDPTYSVSEVARLYGVGVSSLYYHIARGNLEVCETYPKYLVRRSDAERFFASRR